MGIGAGVALSLLNNDHPSIVVEEKWRIVTTAPPVTYLPETPFHMDPEACKDYVPLVSTTTIIPLKERVPMPTTTSTVK